MNASKLLLTIWPEFVKLSLTSTMVCGGIVWFRDGLVVHIEGCETVIFSTKISEHRSFSDIYFIPKLNTNNLNVG
jgi:hypothetical protein